MKPVNSSVAVTHPIDQVFDVLNVMSNHALFTDHYLRNWSYSGSRSGVGAKAKVTAQLGVKAEVDITVTEVKRPDTIVERNSSAGGKRVAEGKYTLYVLPNEGTDIRFEYRWIRIPATDRIVAPVVRRLVRKANDKALERLRLLLLEDQFPDSPTANK
jgi:hypothetical protein